MSHENLDTTIQIIPSAELKTKTKNSVPIDTDIPLGDMPYSLLFEFKKGSIQIIFEYGAKERKKREMVLSGNKIIFGRNSGCVHEIILSNDEHKHFSGIIAELKKLKKHLDSRSFRGRIKHNISVGFEVSEKAISLIIKPKTTATRY